MPTYEYECTRCNNVFEEFKPMSAPKRQRCPKCRGKVERLISGGTGILFKGSGFYINDSRGKQKGAVNSTTSDSGGATTSGKPEAKPASSSTTPKD